MAPKRQPPRKRPVVFIKAASKFSPTTNVQDAVCEALSPLITIEKTSQIYEVSVRFNLQVNPRPLFHAMKPEDQRHAKFLDTIKLEYRYTANEESTSDPSPGGSTTYTVKRANGKKTEVEATGKAAYPSPSAEFRLNVVKEQNVEVTYASGEWDLHVLEKQDVNVDAITVNKLAFKWSNLNPLHKLGKAKSKPHPTKADDTADATKAPNLSNPQSTLPRTKCILMKWETTSSGLGILQAGALDGTTQTITITRHIPAKEFVLRPDYKDDPKVEVNDSEVKVDVSEVKVDDSKVKVDTDISSHVKECLNFDFHVEIDVKELGRGGFRAVRDSFHLFRAPIKPRELYKNHGNAGKSIKPRSSFTFTIGPYDLANDQIEKIRNLLPTKDSYSQSLQKTLGEIHSKVMAGDDPPKKLSFFKHNIEDAKPKGANPMPLMAQEGQSSDEDQPLEDDQPRNESLAIAFIGF